MKNLLKLVPLLLLFATAITSSAQSSETNWCVSAWYYPTVQYPGAVDSVANHLDILVSVNPFWYTPMPDGTLQAVHDAEDEELLAAWREADIRVVPAIFSSVPNVIQDNLRETHAQAIYETVKRMGYDGIDIDYEGFPVETREDFSLFIERLAELLHQDNLILSVTVHPKAKAGGAQDWKRLTAVADVFRIMTYDYTSRNEPPGPIAPVNWVEDVLDFASTVTNLEKVRMGIPFYGYTWQRGTAPSQTVTWSSIQNWVEKLGVEISRNPEDMEAYMDFKVPGLPRQAIYIADATGLSFKLKQIAAKYPDLGGVAIWGVGGEDLAMWDVLRDYVGDCVP